MLKVLEAMTLLQAQALLECLLTQRLLKAVTAKVRQAGPPAIFGPAANTSQQVRCWPADACAAELGLWSIS